MNADEHAERFTLLRPLLFTIAYEILGTATESDDVLQESYLRWAEVDLATVTDTKAYLAKLVTRQALNALRAQARRREEYVGPWLPEPLLVSSADASSDVVLAESVSMAMMVVLETLGPDERAVFVLHEVFGFSHDEIASAIGKSNANVRQLAHRAREHVQARRKRFDPVDPQLSMELTAQFFATAATGDVDALIALMSPDVVWTADSDGKASAARRPVLGSDKVARLVMGLVRGVSELGRVEPAFYNGAPALVLYLGDNLEGVILVEVTDGRITHFYAMRNPEKLGGVTVAREITRLA
jgi:RNA polymerase sigma-70 factor, ECF subfamily